MRVLLLYPLYNNFVPKSDRRPSVSPFVRLPVMFLVNVSSSKLLDVATSNFAGA